MNHRIPLIRSVLFPVYAAMLLGAAALAAEASRKPNVVILFTDDQGTLDAGCYGSKDLRTPATAPASLANGTLAHIPTTDR